MRNPGFAASALAYFLLPGTVTCSAQDAARSSGWVAMPASEYRALRTRAYPAGHEPESPPMDATLTRVDYDLQIAGDLASGRATITIDVLNDGWVRVPIPSGLLVREARLDGKPLALAPGPPGRGGVPLTALLSKRGRAILTLDVALPIASTAGEERLSLPAGASGVTRASVVLSRADVDIKIAGGLLSEKSQSASETRWLAYGRGDGPLTFTWRKRTEDHRITQPLRLRGSLTQLFSLAEDSTSLYAEANLEIVQGAAAAVKIRIPESVTVNQVLGATVADWEIQAGELTVKFLEPVEKTALFVINGEARLPRDGSIDIPLLGLLGAERDSGGIAVEVLGAGEIKDLKSRNLERVDAAELGAIASSRQSPSLIAFRFRPGAPASAPSLAIQLARYDQQAVLTANIEEARYRVLMSADGKTLIQARYAVRNNQRNFLKIVLPAGAAVWSSSLSGRPVRPGQAPDGSWLFPLAKARAGDEAPAFTVELLYLVRGTPWSDRGRAALVLPSLDLPVSKTGVMLYYPPTVRAAAEPGSFRTQAYAPPASSALNTPAGPPPSDEMNAVQQSSRLPQQAAVQALIDRYNSKSEARKSAAALPMMMSFPAVGPSLFLAAELTGENQSPSIDLTYQKEKNGGTK